MALMVMITTFITPPLLRKLLEQRTPIPMDGVASELVMEAPADREARP